MNCCLLENSLNSHSAGTSIQRERHLHHRSLPLRYSPVALFAVNGVLLTHVGCVLSLLEMSEVDKMNDSLGLLIFLPG